MEEMFFCPNCMAKTAPVNGKCPVCGSDVNIQNAPHQLPVNCILNGRYLVGKVLGAGGFGITYIGYDLKLDSKVAIKEYYPSGAANRSSSLTVFPTTEVKGNPFEIGKDRFLKEAKTLSEFVGDGNIVTLRDYFEENCTAYIVMEYLEGDDLSHYAKAHGKFELDEALDLLEPAMLALDKVHKKGLIHRDISPSNIMVMSDGRVKVLDFGSARLQNASGELSLSIMLKPGYAPAEQYSTHGEQGSWTDVYAMSATVYCLITGKTPPPSTDRILDDTIELPSSLGVKITPEQEAALMRGLALRVPDRTQTMAELAKGLREGLPVPDKKQEKKGKTKKPAKPKKKLFIIAAAVLAVLAVCLTVPRTKNNADENNIEDVQDTHLAELAAARKAIAGHRETTLSVGDYCTMGLKSDGTVVAVGTYYEYGSDAPYWNDIIAVSAGYYGIAGLKSDGTVLTAGNSSYKHEIGKWENISDICFGDWHAVGIRADGTVVAAGDNTRGQCNVSDWTDIVAVSAGLNHSAGLKSDGTVVAAGRNEEGQCHVSDWSHIKLPITKHRGSASFVNACPGFVYVAVAAALLFGMDIVSISESSVSSRFIPASIPPCFIRSRLFERLFRNMRTSLSTKVRFGSAASCCSSAGSVSSNSMYSSVAATVRPLSMMYCSAARWAFASGRRSSARPWRSVRPFARSASSTSLGSLSSRSLFATADWDLPSRRAASS